MSEMTRASAIAQLRRHVREHIEIRRSEMELFEREMRLLDDLEEMEDIRLYFNDKKMIVSWTGGAMPFRSSGGAQYRALQAVYKARETGILQADLADEVYGDPVKNVKNIMYALARKMEMCRCPYVLEHDKRKYWLESVEQE